MAAISHASVYTAVDDDTGGTVNVFQDILNTTISHATLVAAGIANGDTVLLIVNVTFFGSDFAAESGIRVADTVGTAVPNSTMRHDSTNAANRQWWHHATVQATKTAGEGFVLQKAFHIAGDTANFRQGGFQVLNLSDLTVNADYVINEDTTLAGIGTAFSTFATVTTPAGDSKWNGDVLVIASYLANTDNTGASIEVRFALRKDTDALVTLHRRRGQDTDDVSGTRGLHVFNQPDTSAHTYEVRMAAVTNATDFDHNYSIIVVFRASLFEDFKFDQNVASLDNPSATAHTEIAGITPFTPQTAGDFLILGHVAAEQNVNSADDNRVRLQVAGVTVPSGFEEGNSTGYRDGSMDNANRAGINWSTIENLAASSQDIDLDAAGDDTLIDWEYRVLVAVSMELVAVAGAELGAQSQQMGQLGLSGTQAGSVNR